MINLKQDSSSPGTYWVWSFHDLRVGHLAICFGVRWNNFSDVVTELSQRAWWSAAVGYNSILSVVQQSDSVISVGTIPDFKQLQLHNRGVRTPLVVTGVERSEQWHDWTQKNTMRITRHWTQTPFHITSHKKKLFKGCLTMRLAIRS